MSTAMPTLPAEEKVYVFNYRARNGEGKVISGRSRATKAADVVTEIERRGLVPINVTGGAGSASSGEVNIGRKRPKHKNMVTTMRSMAALFEAGIDPIETLDVVISDCEDPGLRDALSEVRIRVAGGESLADAMATQPTVFPPGVIHFARAGEASGSAKDAFARIADQYEAEDIFRTKMKKAVTYPIIMMVVAAGVTAWMLMFLVPQFAAQFKSLGGAGAQLPFITRLVIGVSHVAEYVVPALLILAVPGFFIYRANKDKEKVRSVVDPMKLKLPLLGNLFHEMALARMTRNLSSLITAGVERLEALEIAAASSGNIVVERALLRAREAQRSQGSDLAEPMRAEAIFPTRLITLIRVGEGSSRTGEMLRRAADMYDREVDRRTDQITTSLGPLLTTAMAPVIGVIAVAMYMPYLNMTQMV